MGVEWIILLFAYALGCVSPSFFMKKDQEGAAYLFSIVFDILKGIVVMLLALYFTLPELFLYLAGLLVVLGHCFPFYKKFRGGKGISTTLGVIITLWFAYFLLKNLSFQYLFFITITVALVYVFIAYYLTKHYQEKIQSLDQTKSKLEHLEKRLTKHTKKKMRKDKDIQ